jgi:hypothetical protein
VVEMSKIAGVLAWNLRSRLMFVFKNDDKRNTLKVPIIRGL